LRFNGGSPHFHRVSTLLTPTQPIRFPAVLMRGLSVNGQRATADGSTVNDAVVNESIYQQTSVIPNLDSIAVGAFAKEQRNEEGPDSS